MQIGIQGTYGSFHHKVATKLFGTSQNFIGCAHFSELAIKLENKQIDKAVMAIENSIAGAILPNYSLINEHHLYITGEYYLNVNHYLLALPGQTPKDIREIRSHPMALLQCRKFLREEYPDIKLVETRDTAYSAKTISEKKLKGVAAIGSKEAAKLYKLDILAEKIQSQKANETRFVVLTRKNGEWESDFNKVSLKFTLPHQAGALVNILQILYEHQLNMSKIQSVPLPDKPWEYAFFADILITNQEKYQKAIYQIAKRVIELKILGEYKAFKK